MARGSGIDSVIERTCEPRATSRAIFLYEWFVTDAPSTSRAKKLFKQTTFPDKVDCTREPGTDKELMKSRATSQCEPWLANLAREPRARDKNGAQPISIPRLLSEVAIRWDQPPSHQPCQPKVQQLLWEMQRMLVFWKLS